MGNTCVGPSISRDGFLQTVSAVVWRSRSPDDTASVSNGDSHHSPSSPSPAPKEGEGTLPTQSEPPKQITMPKPETEQTPVSKPVVEPVVIPKAEAEPVEQAKPKKPIQFKRVPSAGLRVESVLLKKTGNIKEFYSLGKKLGQGQFGTTFMCIEKATGKEYACKSIAKRKLLTDEDVEDVRREIQIMHHLAGHPHVIAIKGAYEDAVAVHLVMELCKGGELFDRIIQRGHYTERQAADLARTIVGVVETCHSLGVMHRDLKPENFLFVSQEEDSPLKTIDFGLSIFFKPGIYIHSIGSHMCYLAFTMYKLFTFLLIYGW